MPCASNKLWADVGLRPAPFVKEPYLTCEECSLASISLQSVPPISYTGAGGGEACFRCGLQRKRMNKEIGNITTAIPPNTPPTIAPIGGFWEDGDGSDDVVFESAPQLKPTSSLAPGSIRTSERPNLLTW